MDAYESSNTLTEKIISEILCYLSLKTLLRFRSVNKTWKNIIDHLLLHPKLLKKSSFVFIWPCCKFFHGKKLYIVHEDEDGKFHTTKIPWQGTPNHSSFSHSNNGLLCFSSISFDKSKPRNCRTYIYNLGTQCYRRLPNFSSSACMQLKNPKNLTTGFGLDPSTSKVKVVQLFKDSDDQMIEAFIHIIGGSHSWRKLRDVPQVKCYGASVLINGILHWAVKSNGILTFDLVTEKFGFIRPFHLFPFHLFGPRDACILVDLGGCLSVYEDSKDRLTLDIWIMKYLKLQEVSCTKISIKAKMCPCT